MKSTNGRTCIGLAVALLALLASFMMPQSVAAQQGAQQGPAPQAVPNNDRDTAIEVSVTTIELGTVIIDVDATTAVVPVILHPGPASIAAFQIEVVYDADAMTPTKCSHLTGFGVCTPHEDGRLVLNAARIESWVDSTNVVELTFDVQGNSALRVGAVKGVWGDESHDMAKVDYDVMFGAVHVGQPAANQHPGASIAGDGVVTGTASAGVQSSALYGAGVCVIHELHHLAKCSVTNSRGEFRIEGLAAGSYTIEYISADADDAVRHLSGVIVEPGEVTSSIDFDLNEPAIDSVDKADDNVTVAASASLSPAAGPALSSNTSAFSGTVVDRSGQPVTAVLVCATDIGIKAPTCVSPRRDGNYDLTGLLAGNYVLSVQDPGQRYADASSPTTGLNAEQYKQVDFTLTAR